MNAALSSLLCQQWCASADIKAFGAGARVSLPMYGRDGDAYSLYLEPEIGGWSISDKGASLMRLSYEHDLDALLGGQRGKIFGQVVAESGAEYLDGEIVLHSTESDLATNLLEMGRTLTRIEDIGMWTRLRVSSTFYDDLYDQLKDIVGAEKVHQSWLIPELTNAGDYPIDAMIDTGRAPLLVFGVPSSDKAKLVTIILQHLNATRIAFDSLVVYQDMGAIPSKDQRRLVNAANDMIDSIGSRDDLARKIKHRLAA